MLHYVGQRLEGPFVVITKGNCLSLRIGILLIGHKDGYLGAQLGQFEGTCHASRSAPLLLVYRPAHLSDELTSYEGDGRASRGSSGPEAGDSAQVGVCTILVDVFERTEAQILSHPIGVNVFGALVNGK